jgi:hypothetical protein
MMIMINKQLVTLHTITARHHVGKQQDLVFPGIKQNVGHVVSLQLAGHDSQRIVTRYSTIYRAQIVELESVELILAIQKIELLTWISRGVPYRR